MELKMRKTKVTVKREGNAVITTTIHDEGGYHSWLCYLKKGGFQLVGETSGKVIQKYECKTCHARKFVSKERAAVNEMA
jgi:hypothetical protein